MIKLGQFGDAALDKQYVQAARYRQAWQTKKTAYLQKDLAPGVAPRITVWRKETTWRLQLTLADFQEPEHFILGIIIHVHG